MKGGLLFPAWLDRALQLPTFLETKAMKTITTCVALSFLLALSACNTMQGFGKDVSKAGDKIENKADKSK